MVNFEIVTLIAMIAIDEGIEILFRKLYEVKFHEVINLPPEHKDFVVY